MREISRDIVSALIFSKDGKLFMGMKDAAKGGVYSDCWHIPGGGVEEGESFEDALRREILEETGIDLSGLSVQLVDDQGSGQSEKTLPGGEKVLARMKFYVFQVNLSVDAKDVQVQLSSDLVKFDWFSPDQLAEVKLTPPSESLFERLELSKSKSQVVL